MKYKLKEIVVIDFETYYSADYSLRKREYNTSGYIRAPQFKAQCVAIKDGVKKAVWYEGKDIAAALNKHAVASRPVAAHNLAFDGLILSHHYDIVPPFYIDTLSMARAIHGTLGRNDLDSVARLYGGVGKKPNVLKRAKGVRDLPPDLLGILGDYCAQDADECYNILKVQYPVMPEAELALIDWTIRAFCDPILRVDLDLAREEYDEQRNRKLELQTQAETSADILQSADLFAEALLALGVTPPTKVSNTTGEMTYAFSKNDPGFTALLELEDNPAVVKLVEARLATKSTIGETRAKRFLDIGHWALPVGLAYCAAHTTRWGGTNKMNLQNLERDGRLRRAILAPEGHVIVVADSSQIEARMNAWLSDQLDLLDVFQAYDRDKKANPDPYRVMASRAYGKPVANVTADERFLGKVCVLGLGYGMSAKKLRATLALGLMGPPKELDDDEATRLVTVYRNANAKIVEFWELCNTILGQMIKEEPGEHKECLKWDSDRAIWLPNGLGLHYYGLGFDHTGDKQYYARGKPVRIYGALLTENVCQALARVAIGEQLLDIDTELRRHFEDYDTGRKARVVSMTHDEIIAVCPQDRADEVLELMLHRMSRTPSWAPGLPLKAEGDYDQHYSK